MRQRYSQKSPNVWMRLILLTIFLATLIGALGNPRLALAQSTTESQSLQDPDSIELLEKLQSDSYTTRQLALWNLQSLGRDALPIIEEILPQADANLTRELIRTLSSMAAITSQPRSREAHELLEQIAQNGVTLRSQIARQALAALSVKKGQETIENLLLVGGIIEQSDLQILQSKSNNTAIYLLIDDRFSGSLKDLDGLQWLPQLEIVRLVGPNITHDIIEQVVKLPNLKTLQIVNTNLSGGDLAPLLAAKRLEILEILYSPIADADIELIARLPVWQTIRLFGTQISDGGIEELREMQASIDFIFGKGGFLGISSREGCVVANVTPNGAAFEAGVRSFDKITAINGVKVVEFAELRQELSKYAVGEKVTLEIERPNRRGGFERIPQKSEIQRLTIIAELRQQPR